MAWLSDPREMAGITDERDIKYCADVCKVFFRDWNKRQDEVVEPEFEDDVRCELGFAWEERVSSFHSVTCLVRLSTSSHLACRNPIEPDARQMITRLIAVDCGHLTLL